MAKIIPAECSVDTPSKAEVKLFQIFKKNLSSDWTVFHSFSLLARNRTGRIIDAEIDFLLFNPSYGLMVMEVKGGVIAFKDGEWFQNGWKLEKSPAKQALKNKYAILKFLKNSTGIDAEELNSAHALCFPDSARLPSPPAECENICLTAEDLPYIEEAIKKILIDFAGGKTSELPKDKAQLIISKLSPEFECAMALRDSFGSAESVIFNLTEQQCELLRFISEHKRALIRGCAGSGKSIMAVKKAKELAADNKKVLLLAYNSMLSEKLKASTDTYSNIKAISYHDLCLEHLRTNGYKLNPQKSDDKTWTETIPLLFLQTLEKSPLKFDAVIVDEGQDFIENYWEAIEKLVAQDGIFYIFYDPDQNLFSKELSLPRLSPPFILDKNCRNSTSICEKLKPLCSINIRTNDLAPEGSPVCEFRSPDPDERRRQLEKVLTELLENNIYERQITILGGHSMSKTCIGNNQQIGEFTIVENGRPDIMKVPYFTYMKFKGCESDAVILLDVDENDHRWNKPGLCTAISRAKHFLYIIGK